MLFIFKNTYFLYIGELIVLGWDSCVQVFYPELHPPSEVHTLGQMPLKDKAEGRPSAPTVCSHGGRYGGFSKRALLLSHLRSQTQIQGCR